MSLFNKTFFKFAFGFLGIIVLSFMVIGFFGGDDPEVNSDGTTVVHTN